MRNLNWLLIGLLIGLLIACAVYVWLAIMGLGRITGWW